jgi:hypothetical protein
VNSAQRDVVTAPRLSEDLTKTRSLPRSHRCDGTSAVPRGPVQSYVVATPSGHVVFVRDGTLLAQRLDIATGRLTGEATVLGEGLALPGTYFLGRFSISPAMLVYIKAEELPALSELRIFDRTGKIVGTVDEPAGYTGPSLSPDETRLAVARRELTVPSRDIWVFDLAHNNRRQRLTLDTAFPPASKNEQGPAATPAFLASTAFSGSAAGHRPSRHLQSGAVRRVVCVLDEAVLDAAQNVELAPELLRARCNARA